MRCIALPPDRYFTTRLGVDVKKFMSTYLGLLVKPSTKTVTCMAFSLSAWLMRHTRPLCLPPPLWSSKLLG